MAGRSFVTLNWRGPTIEVEVNEALDKVIRVMAKAIIEIAQGIVHVDTGALRASIRAMVPGQEVFFRDKQAALQQPASPIPEPARVGGLLQLLVGGTMWYALEEELRHPYMQPAVAAVQSEFDRAVEANKVK